ncbi:MAG: YdeI/OmpD-associated family protein [Anaerolineales bacterium]|nr:YdeI/OmpD-associated family protein [Anaerolineales bacterium]
MSLPFPDREAWRRWLEENHAAAEELWVTFYKKHSGRASVRYEEAVEEALCFGWIDGLVKRLDDESYAQRFTPRRAGSNWSEVNKFRAARMIRLGKMTPAGMALISFDPDQIDTDDAAPRGRPAPQVPAEIWEALQANQKAWQAFQALPPSHQRQYLGWVMDAKKDETRQRRIEKAIARLLAGHKTPLDFSKNHSPE